MPVSGSRKQWPEVIFTALCYAIDGGGLARQHGWPQEAIQAFVFFAEVRHTSASILCVTLKGQLHHSGSVVMVTDATTFVCQHY